MGKIDNFYKWDLTTNSWAEADTKEAKGKSFSVTSYDPIINNDSYDCHYVILCLGCRVENYTKNPSFMKDKNSHVDDVLSFFAGSKHNIIVKLILVDNDAPLREQGKIVAHYIDSISPTPHIKSINVVGHSKGSIMCFDMIKYLTRKSSYRKTNLFTIATPFKGTLVASPKLLYPTFKKVIFSKVTNPTLAESLYQLATYGYTKICSNSHMDYDIALKDGILQTDLALYDPTLLENIFSKENIAASKAINSYQNICTRIDQDTLSEAKRHGDLTGIGLCISDDILFEGTTSDGMVPLDTQRSIEEHYDEPFKSHLLRSAHHSIMSNPRISKDILQIVKDTIEENENPLSQTISSNIDKKRIIRL